MAAVLPARWSARFGGQTDREDCGSPRFFSIRTKESRWHQATGPKCLSRPKPTGRRSGFVRSTERTGPQREDGLEIARIERA